MKNVASTPPPAVLVLTTAAEIGGMQRVSVALARELAAQGWAVRSVFPRGAETPALLQWCRAQGVAAETSAALLGADQPHRLHDLLALRGLVARSGARVVNVHYGDNFISLKDVLAIRLAGARCVATVHHPTPWDAHNRRKARMTNLAARLVARVVVASDATGAVVRQAGVAPRKIRTIYDGVYPPDRLPTRGEARARLGMPPEAFVIGSLARLQPHKGLADLIDALALVPDPEHALVVAIAGEGPERAALERLAAARLGARARFLGRVPDVADLYAASDLFALPSYLEGFGLVFVEAAFHGVPSIGAATGGTPEAILDGETGVLVPPGDPAALARAVMRLRDDDALRRRLGAAARARAHAHFTPARMAEEYARVLWCDRAGVRGAARAVPETGA